MTLLYSSQSDELLATTTAVAVAAAEAVAVADETDEMSLTGPMYLQIANTPPRVPTAKYLSTGLKAMLYTWSFLSTMSPRTVRDKLYVSSAIKS